MTEAPETQALAKERDALAAFKAYTHARLDSAGIPTHPNGPHSAAGCRVGDRLDILIGERDQLREALGLALCWLSLNEPPDSRAVSDEFVAMAAVHQGYGDAECVQIINAAQREFGSGAQRPPEPEIVVTFGDAPCLTRPTEPT